MAPLTDYETLARLVSAHMTRGVVTNTMVSQEEYAGDLAAGTLEARETPAGLLLLRQRPTHIRLQFYLNDLSVPLGTALPSPTVTEIAFRPRDVKLQQAVDYLRHQGFAPVLERVRLSRPAGEAPLPDRPLTRPTQSAPVLAFLQENFSSLTGCLPTEGELDDLLAQGRVLTLEENGEILGLLHFALTGNTGEIRHLAVRADRRGEGLTRPLLAGYLQAAAGGKSIVWTRHDHLSAQAAYGRFGFVPDGRRAAVLCHQR